MSNSLIDPSGGFGLSPNHTMEIKRDKTTIGFASQPQKVVLFGFANKEADKKFSNISSEKAAIDAFGQDSMLHQMVKASFEAYPSLDCYAYVLGVKTKPEPANTDPESGENTVKTAFKKTKAVDAPVKDTITIDFDLIPDEQYTQFVLPYFDKEAIEKFIEELDSRWDIEKQIDGHLFIADDLNDVAKLKERYENPDDKLANSKHLSVLDTMGNSKDTWIWAATLAAVNAKYATTPSRPYASLELPGVNSFVSEEATSLVKNRKRELRDQLLEAGVSTIKVSSGKVFIDRLVTSYSKEDATGTPDDSYRDLNAKQTISAIRYDWLNFVNKRFERFVLSQDETQKGDFIASPKSMMGLVLDRHNKWLDELLVQDPEGEFIKGVRVEVAKDGEHFLSYLPIHLMGQLRGTHTILAFGKGRL